jgi:hypothetical protein
MFSSTSKRTRTKEVSHLTFLPGSWWKYLDWMKEVHKVVNQVMDGRSSPSMRVLLTTVERSIAEYFGQREFHLAPPIIEYTTYRFREEFEAILTTIALRDSQNGKILLFLLEASTSLG